MSHTNQDNLVRLYFRQSRRIQITNIGVIIVRRNHCFPRLDFTFILQTVKLLTLKAINSLCYAIHLISLSGETNGIDHCSGLFVFGLITAKKKSKKKERKEYSCKVFHNKLI